MPKTSLVFPVQSYPAFAPLPVPLANHLLLQEERRYLRHITKRPTDEELRRTVLERIERARTIVYEYVHPFVQADKRRQQRGEKHTFPDPHWLLSTLAEYTPGGNPIDESTLDHWQGRGLLRREKKRGLYDITSIAALLIARLSEGNLQRNFLPQFLPKAEPRWWCYGRTSPHAPLQSIPIPLINALPLSLALWTPWQGLLWSETTWKESWKTAEDLKIESTRHQERLYRWATPPSLDALFLWERELPEKIRSAQDDSLFGAKRVQAVLLEEARERILASIVRKGFCL